MSMPQRELRPGEEVIFDVRPHWIFLVRSVLILVVATAVGLFVLTRDASGAGQTFLQSFGGILILAALVYFTFYFVRWWFRNLVLTNERVVARWGVLSRSSTEIPLRQISNLVTHQTLLDRLVGAGSIRIESSGTQDFGADSPSEYGVPHPQMVRNAIYEQMHALENPQAAATPPPPPGPDASIPAQIEQLSELVRKGVITPAEFEAKKAELLGRM